MPNEQPARASSETPVQPNGIAGPSTVVGKTSRAAAKPKKASPAASKEKRVYVSQEDVPGHSLEEALKVARAISENYAKAGTPPMRVAQALGVQPGSGGFRSVCGASIAYGLTEGGAFSNVIELTPLGRRIVAPTTEGDDARAKREAVLRPRVLREFLTRYHGSRLPPENIGRNVLEEVGVPAHATQRTFAIIMENAHEQGLVAVIKDQKYVDLQGIQNTRGPPPGDSAEPTIESVEEGSLPSVGLIDKQPVAMAVQNNAVFITHGKNREVVAQIKQILSYGNFKPVVSEERETLSKPVPEKVLEDMRSCSAAIIHVDKEQDLLDQTGKTHTLLNPNVLIEIGAAMALYRGKFILLVQKGLTLPSNLQGLYEVRYEGDKLDYDATMKLLQAFSGFKN